MSSKSHNNTSVSEEHINFILNRKVFLPELDMYYRACISDYDTVFDTNMTFSDLINDSFFIESSINWEYFSKKRDAVIIAFSGKTKHTFGETPIVIGFFLTENSTAPLVVEFILGYDSNGNPNEFNINIAKEKHGFNSEQAQLICDTLFSCLFANRLIQTYNSQDSQQPSIPSIENYNSIIQNNPKFESSSSRYSYNSNYNDNYNNNYSSNYKSDASSNKVENTSSKTKDEYYSQAVKSYNTFIQNIGTVYSSKESDLYKKTKNNLLLCKGYKDSNTMLQIVEVLYNAKTKMEFVSNWEASLSEMEISTNNTNITINKEKFMGGAGGNLILNADVSQKTFNATISNIFATNMRHYTDAIVIKALIVLFSDIDDANELFDQLQDEYSWSINENGQSFYISYEGYNISIQVKPIDYYYIDCTITVSK